MEGQDEMTNILSEADSNNIKRTFAGLSINGCMKMIDSYGTDGANMADTWTVFGDPTIMVRTAVPQPFNTAYDTMLFVTDTLLAVHCNINGARVTATLSGTILATGLVANDSVILTFPALTTPFDTIHLVVSAYNMIPFQDDLIVHAFPDLVIAGFTGLPSSVVPGQSVAFADTSSGTTTSWQWRFPGGTPAMSNEKNPIVTYNTVGTYDVQLIAGNGFSTDSVLRTGYIVVDFPTTSGDRTGSFSFMISPNPCKGNFTLSLESARQDLAKLTVVDMIGNRVYDEKNIPIKGLVSKTIDLTTLPDGIYFLKVTGEEVTIARKLIIKR